MLLGRQLPHHKILLVGALLFFLSEPSLAVVPAVVKFTGDAWSGANSVTFSPATTTGNTIVCYGAANTPGSTVTDTAGNTYTRLYYNGPNAGSVAFYYSLNATSATTITASDPAGTIEFACAELSGVGGVDAYAFYESSGSSNPYNMNPVNLLYANDLVIVKYQTNATGTAQGSYTTALDNGLGTDGAYAMVQPTSGPFSAENDIVGTGTTDSIMVAFYPTQTGSSNAGAQLIQITPDSHISTKSFHTATTATNSIICYGDGLTSVTDDAAGGSNVYTANYYNGSGFTPGIVYSFGAKSAQVITGNSGLFNCGEYSGIVGFDAQIGLTGTGASFTLGPITLSKVNDLIVFKAVSTGCSQAIPGYSTLDYQNELAPVAVRL
jgi:hypothetical protein